MKYMITGGNRGLGKYLVDKYHGDSFSRSNGFDITQDHARLAEISLDYDVVINNAFDGPFQESWASFAQVQLLWSVANLWRERHKQGFIINIGSIGSENIVPPCPAWETYRVSKAALKHHSLQWTQAFKENHVEFRTTLLTLDRLDTDLSRSRATWTGNGHDLHDVANMIDFCLGMASNTCLTEISACVNFEHKH